MSATKGSGSLLRDTFLACTNGIRNNSRGIKATVLTLLVVGILAAIVALGIHYGMGFDNFNKWVDTMKCGPYLGAGLGAATILFIGTLGTAIYVATPPKPKIQTLVTEDFEPVEGGNDATDGEEPTHQ